MGRWVVSRLFVLYLIANMATCALLFMPWALPRETVSGLLGRWMATGNRLQRLVATPLAAIADRIYFWEPGHCKFVYEVEAEARKVLYP